MRDETFNELLKLAEDEQDDETRSLLMRVASFALMDIDEV